MRALNKCWRILTPRERKKGLFLLVVMIAAAFVDVLGVGAVVPFLSILANPESVHGSGLTARVFAMSGAADTTEFLVMLGVVIAVILISTALFRASVMWAQNRFVSNRRHTLSMRLLAGNLAQPYEFFLRHNTAELSKTILGEVESFITDVLRPSSQLISYGLLMVAMTGLVVATDPVKAFALMGTVGFLYYLVWHVSRRSLGQIGQERSRMNSVRYKAALEVMAGVKELRVMGGEKVYLDKFQRSSRVLCHALTRSQNWQLLPRYLMQSFAFAGIIGVAIWMLLRGDGVAQILPAIGIYAFAGYRLLPALQNVYQAASQLRFGEAAADSILAELNDSSKGEPYRPPAEPLPVRTGIRLHGVQFTYEGAEEPALAVEDLLIPANRAIGIVGPTGAGKSTFVDIILGLLRPQSGELLVDGVAISDANVRNWQANIGYVPQHIFLADDTIAANIAFGASQPDLERVEVAARMAQIHDFIAQLDAGYVTVIGERGARLSGGQRQRLGVARALYRQPEVLILDEATSALDSATETAVMEAVRALAGERTVIMIAHRTETLRNCDLVLRIESGRISEVGTFNEVLESRAGRKPRARRTPRLAGAKGGTA